MATSYTQPGAGILWAGWQTQLRVIGALILRELHTRFGRHNIGYLWMIGEPMLLATAIGIIHASTGSHYNPGMSGIAFGIVGYCTFIIFRGIFGRAEGMVEVNAGLLYHRHVSIFDLMVARAAIEAVGCTTTLVILITFCWAVGYAETPPRPLWAIAGLVCMTWISFSGGMLVSVYTHKNHLLGRLVHPFTYFLMPLSGMAHMQAWLPSDIRAIFDWNPMVHIMEMTRYGFFHIATDDYFSVKYIAGFCGTITLLGLIALRRLRTRLSL